MRPRTWSELNEMLFEGSYDERLRRHRSQFAFRGCSRQRDRMKTGLMRLGGDFESLESHLLRNFRKYAHRNAVEIDTPWHWLALAQHHGLPTRLLDFSYSPLVALHFATLEPSCFDEDGHVLMINYAQAHAHVPEQLRVVLEREHCDVYTAEMLAEAVGHPAALAELDSEPYLVFFEPPALAERIVQQYALFSVMSQASISLESWIERNPRATRRVIVPAELKWEIRDKLDQANVTERVLMPGLDGLCRWLTRHYSSRSDSLGPDFAVQGLRGRNSDESSRR